MLEAVIYLVAIAGAEAVTVFLVSPWGMICHIAVLIIIVVRSALIDRHHSQRLLLSLALFPLLRIISLGVAVINLPQIWLYPVIYFPVFLAAVVVAGVLKYSIVDIGLGLQFKWLGIQLIVGVTGILLGLVGYSFLSPEPLVAVFTWHEFWPPALVLLLCTGAVEEFVFRGMIQYGAVEVFGGWGIVYVSLLYAVLYMGFLPVTWVAFAFIISLYFGWIVKDTGSIWGVALAHGISNIALYLVVPFLISG